MTTAVELHGTCDTAFQRVKDAFVADFRDFDEVGASLAVVVDGRPAVDLWGGHADAARTRPWEQDTIVNVWSTTKGLTALCAHQLADRGQLDLDAPVATYWPEFAQAGKAEIPVRYLLSHQAGLPAISEPLPPGSFLNWDTMVHALEKQEPWWEPGTKHGYHAFTYGWLVGEVVRRITGKTLGTYFREKIAEPLGADFHIGTPEECDPQIAEVIPPEMPDLSKPNLLTQLLADSESMSFKAIANPPDLMNMAVANSVEWRRAEIPAANGHGNARSVARIYGALARGGEVDGIRLLGPETIERAIVEQVSGPDEVMHLDLRFAMGWALTSPAAPLGPNPRSFGHSGAGGSLGFADLDAKVGFAYVMNRMVQEETIFDRRWGPLIEAVYASLQERSTSTTP
jgi:CubicO group peptidase (beta-lactamase class C family)